MLRWLRAWPGPAPPLLWFREGQQSEVEVSAELWPLCPRGPRGAGGSGAQASGLAACVLGEPQGDGGVAELRCTHFSSPSLRPHLSPCRRLRTARSWAPAFEAPLSPSHPPPPPPPPHPRKPGEGLGLVSEA